MFDPIAFLLPFTPVGRIGNVPELEQFHSIRNNRCSDFSPVSDPTGGTLARIRRH